LLAGLKVKPANGRST